MPDDMHDRPTNGHVHAAEPPAPEKPRLVVTFASPGAAHFVIDVEGDVHPAQMALVATWLDEQSRGWIRGALREQLTPRVAQPGLIRPV